VRKVLPDPRTPDDPVFFCSDFCKALAHLGRYLLVSLSPSFCVLCNPIFLFSWEFFTTLDYEWRVIRGNLPHRWTIWVRNDKHLIWVSSATQEHRADLLIQQIYLFARVAGLVSVILTTVGLDCRAHINCQVSTVSSTPNLDSDWPPIQGLDLFLGRKPLSSMCSHLREENAHHIVAILFLDHFLPVFGRRFVFDCSSHVRLYPPFHVPTVSTYHPLIDAPSIAIWDGNKAAMATVITLWVIGIGFHLQG
jgi:hypothetical protein